MPERVSRSSLKMENGADIRFIQEMLGHAKLTSTQVYTRVSITKLKAVHTATHPAATLERKGDRAEPQGGPDALEGGDGQSGTGKLE
jgi:integrase/recombinase XerD